jgi:hypothetical protein
MADKMDRGRLLTIGWAVSAAAMVIALPAQSQTPTDVQLRNTSWRVFIDPRTLAIRVQAAQDDMARKAYGIRYKRQPTSSELTEFREQLIKEPYDEGFDRWVEKYLYYDLRSVRT